MSKKILANVLILAPFVITFAFALDIYLPSIPNIKIYYDASAFTVQLTVSFFILMTGLGQLIIGPISDSIGRRKVVLGGTLVFFAGSLMAAFAPNIVLLIFARAIQGAGACSMMVATFAVVRDLYSGDDCARIYSLLNSTISLSPLLAPVIGGYLALWFGWQAGFYFLALVALLIFSGGNFKLKESLALDKRQKLSKHIFSNYLIVIKDRKFQMYTFCSAAGLACFLTFFSVSSYILINLLGVKEQHFGFYFAVIGVVFFFSSLLSARCAKALGTYQTVLLGTLLVFIAGIIMFAWYEMLGLSIAGFLVPMSMANLGGAFLLGGGAGGAIEPFPEMAGAASAVFGASEFLFAFVVSTFVLKWQVKSTLPLSFTLITLGILMVIFCLSFANQFLRLPQQE